MSSKLTLKWFIAFHRIYNRAINSRLAVDSSENPKFNSASSSLLFCCSCMKIFWSWNGGYGEYAAFRFS
ncbi:hypothetical protein CMV_006326 [Castanea mollissima]|uniref:Uncharacterized protein n=1 Tax=Castanea mollissima TaxID=60419 RepID=A0A8J4VTI6_9ROSI|nr:hypothetical protein CMV_006326 [Castanea mollissima]